MTHYPESAAIRALLSGHHHVLVVGHKDPDGDAVGSCLAFAAAARQLGLEATVALPAHPSLNFDWMPGYGEVVDQIPRPAEAEDSGPGFDLLAVLDTASIERTGPLATQLPGDLEVINIDHHSTNTRFGDVNLIDSRAAAAGEILYHLFGDIGVDITPAIASLLYAALLTDSGGFRHENTSSHVLEVAARLAELGADPAEIAGRMYKSRPLSTVRLQAISTATLRLECEGRLAWTAVTRRMLHEAGAVMAEAEGVIDQLSSIRGVEVAIVFKEVRADLTKISVRSRGGLDATVLCGRFGGGGHVRASGAELRMPLDQAIERVLTEARSMIGNGA